MSVVILELDNQKLTKEDLKKTLEEYDEYIKITADISKNVAGIGGMYHYDAEQMLIEKYNSKQSNIWGGGYYPYLKKFRTDALANMRPLSENLSHEIQDPEIREKFLGIAKNIAKQIDSLL